MKSIRKIDIIDKDQIEHTKTEKQILQSIKYQFLVSMHYSFTTEDKIYFITDFMKGGELF